MPFTPYHFGPSGIIALPLKKWIDIPVFVLANVAIDIEQLLAMTRWVDIPLHGLIHTFAIGGLVGLLWGLVAWPAKSVFAPIMKLFRLPYQPTVAKMMASGLLGAWLHVLIDAVLYREMNPFWPVRGNPLHGIVPYSAVYATCEILLIAAAVVYPAYMWHNYRKTKSAPVQ